MRGLTQHTYTLWLIYGYQVSQMHVCIVVGIQSVSEGMHTDSRRARGGIWCEALVLPISCHAAPYLLICAVQPHNADPQHMKAQRSQRWRPQFGPV